METVIETDLGLKFDHAGTGTQLFHQSCPVDRSVERYAVKIITAVIIVDMAGE